MRRSLASQVEMLAAIVDSCPDTRREALAITHVGRTKRLELHWLDAAAEDLGCALFEAERTPQIALIASSYVRALYAALRVTPHVIVVAHDELALDDDVDLAELRIHSARRPLPLAPYVEVLAKAASREQNAPRTFNALKYAVRLLRKLSLPFPDALNAAATQGALDAMEETAGNKTRAAEALGTDRRWMDRWIDRPTHAKALELGARQSSSRIRQRTG